MRHRVYENRPDLAEGKLNSLVRAAANFLLPSRCLACREGRVERFLRGGVCEACWESLPRCPQSRCGVCAELLGDPEGLRAGEDALRCGRCLLNPPPFRSLEAAAPYRGSARQILIAFKFGGADYLAPRLARVLRDRLPAPGAVDEVTAVPATARARRRGEHAADLLGAAVASLLGAPYASGRLRKIRSNERQSGLPLARRAQNVRGVFRARAGAPQRVLLVDDVATSGATARECARLLVGAGAEDVLVWCFARASRDDIVARAASWESGIETPGGS